jgi:cytochrome c1
MTRAVLAAVGLTAMLSTACEGNNRQDVVAYSRPTGGNAARGHELIESCQWGVCQTIPGVRRAHGLVAPPLFWFSRRTFIAGEVPNTPANLVQWVRDPRSIEPHTAMPALGVSEQQARDIAAYLYTLR